MIIDFSVTGPYLTCPDCGSRLVLRTGKYGPFWGCIRYPDCGGGHSAHRDGTPMGVPASAETRKLRVEVHNLFDQLWRGPKRQMTRSQAYRLLALLLNVGPAKAHISQLTSQQCRALIPQLRELLEPLTGKPFFPRLCKDPDTEEEGK